MPSLGERSSPESPPLPHKPTGHGSLIHLSGLQAARRIEQSTERVRQAIRATKEVKGTKGRKRARRQFKRLRRVLESLQQDILSQGSEEGASEALNEHLNPLEQLLDEVLPGERLTAKQLRKLSDAAKSARNALEALRDAWAL